MLIARAPPPLESASTTPAVKMTLTAETKAMAKAMADAKEAKS
jgi:hypothetical protein